MDYKKSNHAAYGMRFFRFLAVFAHLLIHLILVGSAGQPASPSSPVSPTHAGIAVCQLYD